MHAMHHLRMHAPAVGALLRRTRQQRDQFILRPASLSARRKDKRSKRLARRIQKLRRGRNLRERLDRLLPRRIQLGRRDLSLSRQYLPQTHVRLKGSERVSAQRQVWDSVDPVRYVYKAGDRFLVELGELGKDQVPTA